MLSTAARVLALFIAIPIHESSHALVAYLLGDPTAKYAGRLTLNPFRHFDLMGSICLIFAGIGWAKPVPIDPRYFKHKKAGMALSAAAGPISNLLLAFITMIIYKIVYYSFYGSTGSVVYAIEIILSYVILVDISLCIFNLLPAPPFDGGRIFTFFLPEKIYFSVMKYEQYVYIAVIMLVMFGVLDKPLYAARLWLFNGMDTLTGFVDKLMIAAKGLPV